MDALPEMHEKFNEAVSLMLVKKRAEYKFLITEEENKKKVEQVRQLEEILKRSENKKINIDYRTVCEFGIFTVNGWKKLPKSVHDEGKNNVLYYITTDELFDVLNTAHLGIGYGGRNRMMVEIKKK